MDDYKDFLCEYPFQDGRWSFTIKARTRDEAEMRIRLMAWASVKGEIAAIIPAHPGAGLFVRAFCAIRSALSR